MTNLVIKVDEEDRSLKLAREYYQFQKEHGGYSSQTPVEEQRDYKWLKERFEKHNKFTIEERVTHTITDVCGRELTHVFENHGDEDRIVTSEEGFTRIVEVLEEARGTLRDSGTLHEATNCTISKCIGLVEFANKRGYGVVFAS